MICNLKEYFFNIFPLIKRVFLLLFLAWLFLVWPLFCFSETIYYPEPELDSGSTVSVTITGSNNPVPVLDVISPSSKVVGSSGFTMTLTGSDFISSSVVRFAGSDRSTTFIGSTTLTAEILNTDLQLAGNFNITVFNPTPGGGESAPKTFVVQGGGGPGQGNPTPVLISIDPSSKNVGDQAFTMTLTGSDFISSSVVKFAGSNRITTYLSSSTLQAEILGTDLQAAGDFNITVFNPAPDGGESSPIVFHVLVIGQNPIPILSSLSPDSKIVGDATFTMTLTGSDFISSSMVRFAGSDRSASYINSTTLTAQILSSDLEIAGDFNITVFNPTPGGGESNVKVFRVNNSTPTLTLIDPSWKYINSGAFTMTLTGSDFISSSVVRFAGSDKSTTFINSTTLTAQITSSDLQTVGDFNITVFNPTPGGGESSPIVFRVLRITDNPVPSLDTIDPSWKYINSGAFTMRLIGSDFISSSMIRFAGSDRSTTFINPNTLEAYILITDLENVGNFNITVFNPTPGGGESNALPFSVIAPLGNPVPTLTLIDPSWKYINSGAFTMTLTGSDFISSSVVRFAGSDRSTSYINSTTLTAQIPSSDLQTIGDFNITVFNPTPGGGESGTLNFNVRLEKQPPEEDTAPEILEPLDGTYTNNKNVLIKGLAQANKQIDIFVNDQKVKTVSSDQNGNFSTSVILEEGTYFITAVNKDKISKGINLVVDLTSPEPPVLLEARVISQRILSGQINFSLFVQGKNSLDSVSIRAVINQDFFFSPGGEQWQKTFDLSLPPGKHQIYAFAYDLAGNISKPSNVLDFNVGLEVQPPIDIIPSLILTPNLQEITKTINKIIDNPQVEKTTEDTSKIALPIVTVISIGATASAIASTGFSLFNLLPMLYLIFIQPLVAIFSKKRRRGWGVVYNSLTKQPIDLAVLRLFDAKTNRLVATKISDREGRYIFIINPGSYKLVVSKPEFLFPTKFLSEFKEDFRYQNLYHGQEIEIKESGSVINVSIPLDPDKKIQTDRWLIRDHLNFSLKRAIPIAAFIMSLLSFIIKPNLYLLIPLVFNLLFLFVIYYIKPRVRKDWGVVYDQSNKNPLNLSVVRIFESTFNKLLDQQVTNAKGQYGFLAGGRKFYITYNKNGYLEKTSPVLDFVNKEKGAVVGLDAYLRRKQEEDSGLKKNQPNFMQNTEDRDNKKIIE